MQSFTQPISDMLPLAWDIFTHGGFIPFVLLFVYMAYLIYIDYIRIKYGESVKWIILHIKVEKQNLQSSLAVEHIFFQLHASMGSFTWAQKYLEGQYQLAISIEIVSMGGKISYLVRIPEGLKNLAETAFYSYYPNAEISVVEDYMKNLAVWDVDDSPWDLWGTEYLMTNNSAFPIRTYRDFEHPAAEEKIIDPLAGLLEALGKAEAHELMAVQYNIRPKADSEWHALSKKVIAELKGEKKFEQGWLSLIVDTVINFITGKMPEQKKEEQKFPPVQRMSEGEKEILHAVELKMSKTGWDTKIRTLYIAPKDRFDKTKKASIIGAFRQMSGMTTNNLKPDTASTWTDYKYKLLQNLENPYIEWMIGYKKKNFLKAYIERSMIKGPGPMLFNNEELATLFHFPIATTPGAQPVESVAVKKGQPPTDLPVIS